MTPDQYLANLLLRYSVDVAAAEAAGNLLYPTISTWAGSELVKAEFSGSLAKGTAISLGSDADIFISISSTTPTTLSGIYETLYNAITAAGYPARKQNVSIGVTVNSKSIDLVPGKRQSQYGNDHSLYKSKSKTWTKTNVPAHVSYVRRSERLDEIKILKIWRALHGLSFPSFYLELAVIDSLTNCRRGNLASNVVTALQHLENNICSARYVDPANTQNVISQDCTTYEKEAIARQAATSLGKQTWEEVVW